MTLRSRRSGSLSLCFDAHADEHGPGIAMDSSFNVIEQDISLPGGVNLTMRPNDTSAGYLSASISNLQGAVIATTDADGALTGTYSYDPFGNLIKSDGEPTNKNGGSAKPKPQPATKNVVASNC